MRQNGRTRAAASLLAGGSLLLAASGCGGEDEFKNEPRPPVPTQLTGVITEKKVTVSPDSLPLEPAEDQKFSNEPLATPIVLIISNQTEESRTVTLTGKDSKGKQIEARTPPINPLDTAEIQQTLPAGTYEIKAGSTKAIEPGEEISSATLTVKPNRQTGSGETQLP